jgi:hypothetical protein
MNRDDVQTALEEARAQRAAWKKAFNTFNTDMNKALVRLLHEAAVIRMSAEEFASHSGMRLSEIRKKMRAAGLDPRAGKTLLAKTAAEALASNAELLGIKPEEMDLTSPLAYLPAGSELRQQIIDKTVPSVTELPDPEYMVSGNAPVAEGVWCTNCEYLEDPEECPEDYAQCKGCGCSPLDHIYVSVERKP